MNSDDIIKLVSAYKFSFIYSNLTLLVGHPADRLKVAVQINLDQSRWIILKSIATGKWENYFRGFSISAIRQNTKIFHRTLIMSTIPKWIDTYNFNFGVSSLFKGFMASTIDTFITSPFENVKTL